MFMGDSVLRETWQAGLCSLARARVEFFNACPLELGLTGVGAGSLDVVCFQHPHVNGIGVLAVLADQGFIRDMWKSAIYGCHSVEDCQVNLSDNYRWDVILPNLGMHYNLVDNNSTDQLYRLNVGMLIEFMLDHAQYQVKSNESFPTLHSFWGSSPQVSFRITHHDKLVTPSSKTYHCATN